MKSSWIARRGRKKLMPAIIWPILLFASPLAWPDEVFQVTSFTLAYTEKAEFDPLYGTGTDDEKLTTFRLDHYGVHGFGDNYLMAEVYRGKNVGNIPSFPGAGSFGDNTKSQSFIVFNPRVSLGKVGGKSFSFGAVKDLYLAARLEYASYGNFLSDNIGISADWRIPGTTLFLTDFYSRNDEFTGDTTSSRNLFFRNVIVAPFQLSGLKFNFVSTLYINDRKDYFGTQTFLQPDLTVLLGNTGLELGYRHEMQRYRNYSRNTPTLLAKWNF